MTLLVHSLSNEKNKFTKICPMVLWAKSYYKCFKIKKTYIGLEFKKKTSKTCKKNKRQNMLLTTLLCFVSMFLDLLRLFVTLCLFIISIRPTRKHLQQYCRHASCNVQRSHGNGSRIMPLNSPGGSTIMLLNNLNLSGGSTIQWGAGEIYCAWHNLSVL